MKVKHIWSILFLFVGLVVCYLNGNLIYKLCDYLTLSQETRGRFLKTSVVQNSNRFLLCRDYSYQVNGKEYLGKTVFQSPFYLNRHSAEEDIKGVEIGKVFYSFSNPSFSTAEKRFPKNLFVRALLANGVLLYFIYLGRQGAKEKQTGKIF